MKTKFLGLVVVLVLGTHLTARAAGYVAHEWGTFTSVQGSDGQLIAWNPFTVAELPSFVHERNVLFVTNGTNRVRVSSKLTPTRTWLQRMETPVIYFYADAPMRADVTVDFPDGEVTEWFPRVASFGPRGGVKRSFVRWAGVNITPASADAGRALPADKSGSHYYAARETDAALVTVEPPFPTGRPETDKFLFYRGVGNFKAPLHARFDGDKLVLLNRGGDELPHLFVLEVRGSVARTMTLPGLSGGGDVAVALPAGKGFRPLIEVRAEISAAMEKVLAQSGLYPREAAAMVKTWADSWFSEPGMRVLYTLPRAWTDRVLPLKLDPAPRELVRVMVGRAEIFTPMVEHEVIRQFSAMPKPEQRTALVQRLNGMGLGRFAEAAVVKAESVQRESGSTVTTPAVAGTTAAQLQLVQCGSPIPPSVNATPGQPQTTLLLTNNTSRLSLMNAGGSVSLSLSPSR